MIVPEPFFEPRGTPFSVRARLRVLSQLGHEVDLITYPIGEDVTLPGVSIYRTPSIPFIRTISIGPSAVKLFLDFFLCGKAFMFLTRNQYDLVHSHEEAGFFGVLLSKWFRKRHLYDMHSSLPQQLENFQYTRIPFLLSVFKWLERLVINKSDAIITICPALQEYVNNINSHVPQMMIENVPSEEDEVSPSERDKEAFKHLYSLDDRKMVLYAGTFEPYQGIDLLIDSARYLIHQMKKNNVVFLLIGGKPHQVKYYKKRVEELKMENFFRFTGTLPPEEIPVAVQVSSLLVSPRTRGTNTPLKIYSSEYRQRCRDIF